MTTASLSELGFEMLTPGPETDITGGFCGDLLSWVMGRAEAGQVWFTVMGNANAVAVASLTGVAAVVLCNGAGLDEEAAEKAREQQIAFFCTPLTEYEAAVRFAKILDKQG